MGGNLKDSIVKNLSVEEFLYYYTGVIKIQSEKTGFNYYFGHTSEIHNQENLFLTMHVKYATSCLHYECDHKHAEYSSYLIIYV